MSREQVKTATIYQRKYLKKKPWMKHLSYVRNRCKSQKYYTERGTSLTPDEVERLWYRDNADTLLKPSIDRIDNSQGYSFNNCRFIELSDNVRQYPSKQPQKAISVKQIDKVTHQIIAIFESIMEASRMTNISHSNIAYVIKNKRKSAGGYLWEEAKR